MTTNQAAAATAPSTRPTPARAADPDVAPSPGPARSEDVGTVLVTAASGKTGTRVVERLERLGVRARAGSRSGPVRFDWEQPATWGPALDGVDAVYVCYVPDLAVPGAPEAVGAFVDEARARGVRRVVLLSGRGEVEAERAEGAVRRAGLEWTVVRSAWFAQNLSEGFFVEDVLAGELALPVGDVAEPWVDLDDVADVVVAALTGDGHAGRTYDVTGPRLLTFDELAAEVSAATGRPLRFRRSTLDELTATLRPYGDDVVWLMTYLVTEVLDGRNAHLGDGVRQALRRAPRDIRDYARDAAAAGAWGAP